MKYNRLYLLALCGILFAACQSDQELEYNVNPGDESKDELQEVSFAFSFDAAVNMEIEYEPMTRSAEGEDWVRISNTFFYVVQTQEYDKDLMMSEYTIVKSGKGKFNSKKGDEDYVYLPEELDPDFRVSLEPGEYLISIFTGANAVVFNEDELVEGYSYIWDHKTVTDEYNPPFAIRYKQKETHAIRNYGEIFPGEGPVVSFDDYFLDEVIYNGMGRVTVSKKSQYRTTEELEAAITLYPQVTTVRPLLQFADHSVLAEWNQEDEPMVACIEVEILASPEDGFADGINLLGMGWFNPEEKIEKMRLYYYIDPEPQEGYDKREYLTGTPDKKEFYLLATGKHGGYSYYVSSVTVVPAGMMSLYNPDYAVHTTQAIPVAPVSHEYRSIGILGSKSEQVYAIQKGNADHFELEFQNHPLKDQSSYENYKWLALFPYWHDYYNPENK